MIAIRRQPGPSLGRFVDSIWLYDGYQPDHAEELHLPDASLQLVIDLRDSRPAAGIVGPSSRPYFLTTDCQFSVIGVQVRPGGAPAVLGSPVRAMLDQNIDLGEIWGPVAGELQERLRHATSPKTRLEIVDGFLSARVREYLAPAPALALAVQKLQRYANPGVVSHLARYVGLTPARFMQQFEDAVGLKPKLFQRLHRFQRAARLIHGGRERNLTCVALEAGYYDQAHFTRDFRSFAEMTPSAYRERFGEHVNHVAFDAS
jgi:AraC-like DNA-binding protein